MKAQQLKEANSLPYRLKYSSFTASKALLKYCSASRVQNDPHDF